MAIKNWASAWHWRERINNFEPSWFIIVMSTGTLQQCYVNFPYPIDGGAEWLRDIGYVLWILEVVLMGVFLAFLTTRYIRHPVLLKKNILEFPQSSFCGAIPISLNTIVQGFISYYDYRSSGAWAAYALYWVCLVLSLGIGFGLITIQMIRAKEQKLEDVAGIWVMTTVPLFSTALTAGNILPYVNRESVTCAITVLVTGFMCFALALSLLTFILAIYFFRLIANKLPPQPLLAASFLPAAALSQGALAIQRLGIYFANYLIASGYGPTQSNPPPLTAAVIASTAEVMHWLGIIMSLALLAHATFWVFQATAGVLFMLPKLSFSIAYWSLVFPIASYANAWAFLGRDMRNDGMRGWAATWVMIATLLWLFCAAMTTWYGIIEGSLFSAPGLEDWIGDKDEQDDQGRGGRHDQWNGTYDMPEPGTQDEEKGPSSEGGQSEES